MGVTNLRGRNGQPINVDRLMVGGVDIASILAQLSGVNMGTSSSIVTLTEKYLANATGVGYSSGDILRRTELIDVSVTPPTAQVYWYNFTTASTMIVAPTVSQLTLQSQSGLTDVELRASPVTIRLDPTSPDVVRLGNTNDDATAADGTGAVTVLSGLRRLIMQGNDMSSRLPARLGQATASQSIPVVLNSDSWESAGWTVDDATGNMTQERQSNGVQIRTRTWSSTTDAQGKTTQVPGQWIYS